MAYVSEEIVMMLLTAVLTVGTATGLLLWYYTRKPKYEFYKVGEVSKLFVYPIKSCRGISVTSAECTTLGLKHGIMRDRVFLLVTDDGTFVTARQEHSMLLISPSFKDDCMLVNAPNMETLEIHLSKLENDSVPIINCKVWGQNAKGCDCGDEVARWFQKFLGKEEYRLLYFRLDLQPKRLKERKKYQVLVEQKDAAAYADFTPYMLMAEPSIADLNRKIDVVVCERNFRPNIVVKDSQPYDEDNWKMIKIGSQAIFRNVKPCQRCILTTIDPETGIKIGEDPLKTLKTYRKTTDPFMKQFVGESALLGVGLCIDRGGQIHVGDAIYTAKESDVIFFSQERQFWEPSF